MSDQSAPLLKILDVYKYYDLKTLTFLGRTTEKVKAVRGVSLDIDKGETIVWWVNQAAANPPCPNS